MKISKVYLKSGMLNRWPSKLFRDLLTKEFKMLNEKKKNNFLLETEMPVIKSEESDLRYIKRFLFLCYCYTKIPKAIAFAVIQRHESTSAILQTPVRCFFDNVDLSADVKQC